MGYLLKTIIFIIVPFICCYGYVTEKLKVRNEFKRTKQLVENNFKPFWLETNKIFREVTTKEDFLRVSLKFKELYPHENISILKLKISKLDFNIHSGRPKEKEGLISFGLRNEHIHNHEYTLEDYFKS